ncbi:type VII secretion-associated protein [Corynebacterium sp.]|jgi:type VII secretion-associated protein (TIGR03931 family)|uniref:type VII secretion-associated protein n=1 Tax=Corynebacterium sp. TaxID=1720 RepID=UPI0025BF3538|nr:type VII secretion-associated protein [Corynebacterium sp.]
MNTGMVASAVALTESGVLVNGLCATDLLSGFEVRCADGDGAGDPTGPEGPDGPDGPDGPAGPVFRGSQVPLRRLEAVRELVAEVLDVRASDPELTSANPVVPRTVFPWGIGSSVSDVLVAGPDKDATAAYLRMTGLRARTVDVSSALRLAGDLAEAREEVEDRGTDAPDEDSDEYPAGQAGEERGRTVRDGTGRAGASRRVPVLATVVAVTAVVLVGLVAGNLALRTVDPGLPGETATAARGAPERDRGPRPEPGPEPGPESATAPGAEDGASWRDMSAGGPDAEGAAGTPDAVVSVDVPGWRMTESTPDSEIWTSGDEGMRVLVAARPTPVGTQDELDAVMLRALDGLGGDGGDGGVVVTDRSPVAYEERFPDSTTSWRVLLVDGHQVSVGCQYRELTEGRRENCDRFTATARVTAGPG